MQETIRKSFFVVCQKLEFWIPRFSLNTSIFKSSCRIGRFWRNRTILSNTDERTEIPTISQIAFASWFLPRRLEHIGLGTEPHTDWRPQTWRVKKSWKLEAAITRRASFRFGQSDSQTKAFDKISLFKTSRGGREQEVSGEVDGRGLNKQVFPSI